MFGNENENTQDGEQNLGEGGEQIDSSGEDTAADTEVGSEENGSEGGEQLSEDTTESGETADESAGEGTAEEKKTDGYKTELSKEVEFEGKKILAVLHDGRETETLYHCKFSDGTTGHVPKDFLDKELASEE